MKSVKWIESVLFEDTLNNLGLKWEFVKGVHASRIDMDKGRLNHSRMDGSHLDADNVRDFTSLMKSGKPFVAPVLHEIHNHETYHYGISDGRHRLASYGAFLANGEVHVPFSEDARIDAYIINSKENSDVRVFQMMANRIGGKRTDAETGMQNALKMLLDDPRLSVKNAAIAQGVNEKTLKSMLDAADTRDELEARAIDVRKIKAHSFVDINRVKSKVQQRKIAEVASECGLSGTNIKELCTEVNRKKTVREGNILIEEKRQQMEARQATTTRKTQRNNNRADAIERAMGQLNRALSPKGTGPIASLSSVGITSREDVARFMAHVMEISAVWDKWIASENKGRRK